MNQGKARGSLAKSQGRTGIYTYGPSDRDLADQIGSAHILIGAVVSGSGGHGRRGLRVAARLAGTGAFAAALHRRCLISVLEVRFRIGPALGVPAWHGDFTRALGKVGQGSGEVRRRTVFGPREGATDCTNAPKGSAGGGYSHRGLNRGMVWRRVLAA